jgi:opacity protein-like surface antigen
MSKNSKIAILAVLAALVAAPAFAAKSAKHRRAADYGAAYGYTVNSRSPFSNTTLGYDRELVGRLPLTAPFANGY